MKDVRSIRFGYVSEALRRRLGGQDTDRLLRQVGRFVGVKQPATVKQEAALVRAACLQADDPTLAAQIGMGYRDAPTLSAYIAAGSATLRDALHNAARFYGLADSTTEFAVVATGEGDVLTVMSQTADLQANDRFQEFLVFGALARVQSITRRQIRPAAVVVRHAALGAAADYERLAGCPVIFGGAHTGIRFAAGALDQPLAAHDPDLVAHLTDLAEAQLAAKGTESADTRGRVERLLVTALPARFLTADEVAAGFAITRRTLTRKLTAEGTSFREVSAGLRYRLAQAYLREGRSVTETAFLLGYGDQATFSAAFRGWSGTTPSAFAAEAVSSAQR